MKKTSNVQRPTSNVEVRRGRQLPPKSPLPESGELARSERYFDVGDKIQFENRRTDKFESGIVTAVKINVYGRVSYYVGEELVLTEEVQAASKSKSKSEKSEKKGNAI